MPILTVKTRFAEGFDGVLETSRAKVAIGSADGGLAPYDMLLGALASCLYATFLDIVEKKRLTLSGAEIEVQGEKRADIPTTLRWVNVRLGLRGASDLEAMRSAAELAGKYCSIYQTLSHVAEMHTEVELLD